MTPRAAEQGDAISLAALSVEVWMSTYLKRGVAPEYARFALSEFTEENLRDAINASDTQVFVVDGAEGPIGYIRLAQNRPSPVDAGITVEIETFYVQPHHHGKGAGRALLSAAVERARGWGADALWLATNAENTPAIGFYLGNGFKTVGKIDFHLGDAAYPNDVFHLSI